MTGATPLLHCISKNLKWIKSAGASCLSVLQEGLWLSCKNHLCRWARSTMIVTVAWRTFTLWGRALASHNCNYRLCSRHRASSLCLALACPSGITSPTLRWSRETHTRSCPNRIWQGTIRMQLSCYAMLHLLMGARTNSSSLAAAWKVRKSGLTSRNQGCRAIR